MDRFLELFGHFIEFAYAIWDRIVLRGYYADFNAPRTSSTSSETSAGSAASRPRCSRTEPSGTASGSKATLDVDAFRSLRRRRGRGRRISSSGTTDDSGERKASS